LAEEALLADDFLRQLINVGEVDILVGLRTHNNAKTIEPVMRAIQTGILKCFPRERAVIIDADGGSQDRTPELVVGASIDDVWSASKVYALRTLHSISTRYARSPEPGTALRTILAAADLLRAKACVVISPDSITIEPDWLQRLVRPVYNDNFDLVIPLYSRQKFEGVLMRNLLYPMTRAIYGYRVREPYASEFAISGRLATDFLNTEIWNDDRSRIGAEICLTITAITGNYRVCQSFLGPKAQPDRSASDLVAAMRQTVGALFSSLDSNFPLWSTIAGSQPVPTLGAQSEVMLEPVRVNRKRLREMFATGVAQLEPVFRSILSASTLSELQRIATLEVSEFNYPADLWAKTVFEFAASYHKSVISRDHIVQALVPLYRGRTLTFLLENRDGSGEDIERNLESLCGDFERLKPYLLEVWPDRK
jgi:glycosyltransferase involved in cell wall biosynthesis